MVLTQLNQNSSVGLIKTQSRTHGSDELHSLIRVISWQSLTHVV